MKSVPRSFAPGALALVALVSPATDAFRDARAAFVDGRWESAVATLDGLFADELLPEAQRARVAFAKGVVLAEEREDSPITAALAPFESARVLAGPSALRRDATYDRGWVELAVAEAAFRAVEAAAAPAPMQPPPAPPQVPGAGGEEPPDFATLLEAARVAYAVARDTFLVRLRDDWRDEDTRANLEWIQRRLAELDELERQHEEQEQQQQESDDQQSDDQQSEDQGDESEDQQDESSDSSDSSEGEQDREQQDQQDQPQDPQDGQDEQQDGQPEDSEESAPEDRPPPAPEEGAEPEAGEEPPTPPEGTPEERYLTREEVQRLLDRLGELEEEGERVRAALRRSRRVPVERDW